jgi:hypothetical protein
MARLYQWRGVKAAWRENIYGVAICLEKHRHVSKHGGICRRTSSSLISMKHLMYLLACSMKMSEGSGSGAAASLKSGSAKWAYLGSGEWRGR